VFILLEVIMGITERKEREKEKMRKLILKTAMELFLKEGYATVSLRRIAKKIEYSPATIYLYFKDKNEILYALHNEGFEELFRRQQAITPIKDLRKRLRKHGEIYLDFAFEHPEYYNLMFIMRGPAKKIVESEQWQVGIRSYDLLKKDVQECMKAGILKNVDLDVATFALWSVVHGIASLILRNRCPMLNHDELPAVAKRAVSFINENIGIRK
jgi:AcrR family transcriptional regulator